MPHPLVSVLLPCHNDGEWLDEAIQSVLDQTYPHFELIVVDDGSTDPATIARLDRWNTAPARVIRSERRGLPGARNLAARHAVGDLLCALDADDRLAPTWFEKGVKLLEARPELTFVSHWLETFGDERWTWTPERCDLPALLARNTINGAALVRRTAFDAVGGYDERMRHGCEDWDFWLRLVERGYHGAIVPEVLFFYRRRPSSMSRIMTADAGYWRPLEQLVARHELQYREHLVDVLIAREAEKVTLRREVLQLEANRLLVTEPSIERAREERDAVLLKVERERERQSIEDDRNRLAFEASELRREVAALRTSWSWRITSPLRRLYAAFARLAG